MKRAEEDDDSHPSDHEVEYDWFDRES